MPDDLVTRLRERANAIADCYDDSFGLLLEAAQTIVSQKDALAAIREESIWSDIRTAPQKKLVLVALMDGEVIRRVSDGRHNGLGWYTRGGESCHWATHWLPMPPWWPQGVPTDAGGTDG